MSNPAPDQLIGVVASWYLRKWKLLRVLAFTCVGLVAFVLLIVGGAALEGGSGVAAPLVMALALGVPSFLFAHYAHEIVTQIDRHELVSALRTRPDDVEIAERSWTIVPDFSVAGLLAGRKERMPCLKLAVGASGKRYLVPMTDEQCDAFFAWLGAKLPLSRAA